MFADPPAPPGGYIKDLHTGEAEVLKLSPDLSRCVLRLGAGVFTALALTRQLRFLFPVLRIVLC